MSGYLRTPTVFHRVSPKRFLVQKDGTRGWVARCCLLRCEGCWWIGLKPRFTLGPCFGTLRTQLCMCTLLPFHIWMSLKLVSSSHVWISPPIVVTCSLASFASSMCSWPCIKQHIVRHHARDQIVQDLPPFSCTLCNKKLGRSPGMRLATTYK